MEPLEKRQKKFSTDVKEVETVFDMVKHSAVVASKIGKNEPKNVELELKAEKANAEIRLTDPSQYQAVVDAEWQIIYDKLDKMAATGAKVILSKLAIGDLATQYFADRDIFCAGPLFGSLLCSVIAVVDCSLFCI